MEEFENEFDSMEPIPRVNGCAKGILVMFGFYLVLAVIVIVLLWIFK